MGDVMQLPVVMPQPSNACSQLPAAYVLSRFYSQCHPGRWSRPCCCHGGSWGSVLGCCQPCGCEEAAADWHSTAARSLQGGQVQVLTQHMPAWLLHSARAGVCCCPALLTTLAADDCKAAGGIWYKGSSTPSGCLLCKVWHLQEQNSLGFWLICG